MYLKWCNFIDPNKWVIEVEKFYLYLFNSMLHILQNYYITIFYNIWDKFAKVDVSPKAVSYR